jgi:hypothetical protein
MRPRKTWKKICSLQAGNNFHHQVNPVVNFVRDGIKATNTNDKENLEIDCSHFEKVYNRESLAFDPMVINKVMQCPEDADFDQLSTLEELNKVIANIASLAAPGESGLSLMAKKKLPKEANRTGPT